MSKRTVQKKVCLLGDFAVGKTSLVRRFVEGRFDDKYLSTIGVKISRKSLSFDDAVLNLLIWDLAGGDDFRQIGNSYLRGASAALIVCDLTRHDTLDSFHYYTEQLHQTMPNASLVFIGNKVDLTEQRVIDQNEIEAISRELGGPYLETSAKTGFQVESAFHFLANSLLNTS